MAAGTAAATLGIISGAASVAGAGLGVGQMISGAVNQKKAQSALGTALTDLRKTIQEGQANRMAALQVPTKGAELRERALTRATAGGIEAAQESGAAGVIGSAGRLQVAADEQAAGIAADLDKSITQRDKLVLEQEQKIEAQRYQGLAGLGQMEVAGAQQAIADAQAQKQAGAQTIGTALTNIAGIAGDAMNPYGNNAGALSFKDWSKKQEDAGFQGTREDYKIYLQNL